ncbi:MAG: DUF1353 domain-containing protein [Syntrophales bacterium]
MSSFTDPLCVEILADGVCGRLLKGFEYHVGAECSPDVIKVPAGFVTDFASTPFFSWILFPKTGLWTKSAVLHDYIYQSKLRSRHMADLIFKEAMEVLGVPRWKRDIMYLAVRTFGFIGYSKNNLPK